MAKRWSGRGIVRVLACVLALAALCGCRVTGAIAEADTDGEATAAATGDQQVPAVVEQLEERALAMYNTVKADDWQKAQADLGWFDDALPRVNAQVKGEPTLKQQFAAAVEELRGGVSAQDRQAAMRGANRITRVAGYMRAPLDAKVPASVTLLGYYGRELEIWSAAKDQQMLKVSAAGACGVWTSLRPLVVAEGGEAEAGRVDATVAALSQAATPEQYGQSGAAVQSGAEEVRRVFLR